MTLEAPAIRAGPVTFEVHNGGKLVHGFEMEAEGAESDNSGPGGGSDDGFKIEKPSFRPGQTLRFPLNLAGHRLVGLAGHYQNRFRTLKALEQASVELRDAISTRVQRYSCW